jgi:hypothetical protein
MRYAWLLALMLVLLLIASMSFTEAGGDDLDFLAIDRIIVVSPDATIPEGAIWLDAEQVGTCKPDTCMAVGDCAGNCVSGFQRRPGEPDVAPGVWAWRGACTPGRICMPKQSDGINSSTDIAALCGCVYNKACTPDYEYVASRRNSKGTLSYLVMPVPQPSEEPEACQ